LQDAFCMGTADWAPALNNIGSKLNSGQDFGCNDYTPGTYSDWRMPNRYELESLLDLSQAGPALPSGHPFSSVLSLADYWTSTTYADDTDRAWLVNFGEGDTLHLNKGLAHISWPVRGGQ
jgi:hypothetical protein